MQNKLELCLGVVQEGHNSLLIFFCSSRRRPTSCSRDWSSGVCSSDLKREARPQSRAWKDYSIGAEIGSGRKAAAAAAGTGGVWILEDKSTTHHFVLKVYLDAV